MIKNRSEMLSHGFVEGREKALDIAEYALGYVDPYAAVKHYVKLEGSRLLVDDDSFDLDQVNNIYAIGAGKATYPLAAALEEILGDRITDGFISIKKGQKESFLEKFGALTNIRSVESAHPVPDAAGYHVLQSVDPSFGSAVELIGNLATGTELTLPDGARTTPELTFFQVRGVNSCHQEGP